MGSCLWDSLMFPCNIIQKQLAWYNAGIAYWWLGSNAIVSEEIASWKIEIVLQISIYSSIYSAVSSRARINRSMNQGLEMEVAFLFLTPNNPLQEFLLPIPATLSSDGLEVLVLYRKMFHNIFVMKHNSISIAWEVEMPLSHFGLLMPQKGIFNWVRWLTLITKGELSLLHNRDRYPRFSLEAKRFSGKPLSTSISNRKD